LNVLLKWWIKSQGLCNCVSRNLASVQCVYICQQIDKDDCVEYSNTSDDPKRCDDVYNNLSLIQQVKRVCFGCD